MENSKEIIACFREEDLSQFHTGKLSSIVFPKTRSEKNKEFIPFIICRVYAFTKNELYLVQRRSRTRRVYPLTYCDSASGHVQYVKNFNFEHIQNEAWRELFEEMGATIIYGRLLETSVEYNREKSCEMVYTFVALIENKFQVDNYETDSHSGLFSKNELKKMLGNMNFVPITKDGWEKILSENYYERILLEYNSINKQKIHKKNNSKFLKNSKDLVIEEIGSIVGRFQPFHNGHLKLLQNILKQVKFLKIGIGSSQFSNLPDNPFSFDNWILILIPQFFLELITTQLRFYMVSPQLSLLIILTMQSYKFYLDTNTVTQNFHLERT